MPREKKDGQFVNIYLRKDLYERLENYCRNSGVTKTFAIEKGTEMYLEKNDPKQTADGQQDT